MRPVRIWNALMLSSPEIDFFPGRAKIVKLTMTHPKAGVGASPPTVPASQPWGSNHDRMYYYVCICIEVTFRGVPMELGINWAWVRGPSKVGPMSQPRSTINAASRTLDQTHACMRFLSQLYSRHDRSDSRSFSHVRSKWRCTLHLSDGHKRQFIHVMVDCAANNKI